MRQQSVLKTGWDFYFPFFLYYSRSQAPAWEREHLYLSEQYNYEQYQEIQTCINKP